MNPAKRNNSEYERLDAFTQGCICGPAIAGIGDGPNTDCPQHGDAQDAAYPTLSTLRAALRAYGDYRRQSSHMNASIHSQAMRAALRAAADANGGDE